MSFWKSAEAQAGRELGARLWVVFAVAKVLKAIWPGLVALLAAGLAVLGYRAVAAAASGAAHSGALMVAVMLGGAALLIWAGIAVSRAIYGAPRRRRRYR